MTQPSVSPALISTLSTYNTLSLFPQNVFLLEDGENRKLIQTGCTHTLLKLFENAKEIGKSKDLSLVPTSNMSDEFDDSVLFVDDDKDPTKSLSDEEELCFGNSLVCELHKTEKNLFDQSLDAFLFGASELKAVMNYNDQSMFPTIPSTNASTPFPSSSSQNLTSPSEASQDSSSSWGLITPSWIQSKDVQLDESMKEKLTEMLGLKTPVQESPKEPKPKSQTSTVNVTKKAKTSVLASSSSSPSESRAKKNFNPVTLSALNGFFNISFSVHSQNSTFSDQDLLFFCKKNHTHSWFYSHIDNVCVF